MDQITSDRSLSLIGEFMLRWSVVEYELDGVIREIMRLDVEQSHFLSHSLSVARKIDLLQKLINSSFLEEDDKEQSKKIIGKLYSSASDRNMVAHSMFFPSEDGLAIEFFRVKTIDKKLKMPMIKWDGKKFKTRLKQLDDLALDLGALRKKMGKLKSSLLASVLSAGHLTRPL